MRVPRKGSGSSSEEQWSVLEHQDSHRAGHICRFSFVVLRSDRGNVSRGLKCFDCGLVELISERQWRHNDRRIWNGKA